MKKWIWILVVLLMMLAMTGCVGGGGNPELPKGHAAKVEIDWGSGKTLNNVDYEFITETTVKITFEDGDVMLYPLDKIIWISVEGE